MSQENQIVEYGITDAALAELKSKFSLVPDPSTKEGYAEIKASLKVVQPYLKKLEDKRVELKADSLARGRLIDSEAKRIKGILLEIRDQLKLAKQSRDDELEAIKQAELDKQAAHISAIEQKVADINSLVEGLLGADLKTLQSRLKTANETVINNVEFEDQIDLAKESMLNVKDALEKAIAEREVFEAQQAEQAEKQRLMNEKQAELDAKQAIIDNQEAAQKQKERDELIAKEAAQSATKEAEKAAAKREQELKEEKEQAERKTKETEQRLLREAEDKKQREIEEAEAREKNKKHKASINNAAVEALVSGGMTKTHAKQAITLIAKREIPNVVISY